MPNTVRGIVREGKIEVVDPVNFPEGSTVLVTLLGEEDPQFWTRASQVAVDTIWENSEDDVYAELLKE